MINADNLVKTQTEILGEWYISKPLTSPFMMRLKDAWSVLLGDAQAVSFTEVIDVKEMMIDKINTLYELDEEFKKNNKKCNEAQKKVLSTKLDKNLTGIRLTMGFDGSSKVITMGEYTFIITDKIMTVELNGINKTYDNEILSKIYKDVKFKFIFDKTTSIYKELDKARETLLTPIETDNEV